MTATIDEVLARVRHYIRHSGRSRLAIANEAGVSEGGVRNLDKSGKSSVANLRKLETIIPADWEVPAPTEAAS